MNELISWVIPGRLARSACPGFVKSRMDSGATLVDWAREAREKGISDIFCLLDQPEIDELKRTGLDLQDFYSKNAFHVHHFPIPDRLHLAVPDNIMEEIKARYSAVKGPVVVHCFHGVARTGYAVATLRKL